MKYLKSLYIALKLFIKSIRDAFIASRKMNKQFESVSKLAKEHDWKNKTPEEFLEAVRMTIEIGSMLNPNPVDELQKRILNLKEEQLLIQYALKEKKGWIGNTALDARIKDIERLLSKLQIKLNRRILTGTRVLLHDAENCPECRETFLALYSIKNCKDHEGFDKI